MSETNDQLLPAADASPAEELGIKYSTVQMRYRRGERSEEALFRQPTKGVSL